MPLFYGWWIVVACLVAALFGNALGLFGAGVYLHAAVEAHQWSLTAVSGAATLFYLTSALLLIPVGTLIARNGPRLIMAGGGLALLCGVVGIGQAHQVWQAYAAFLALGIAWACLSTTAVATTLAPWFDKHQGRAVSIASLGASAGGMLGAPILVFGIARIGFGTTTIAAGLSAFIVIALLAVFVLKHRPQDLGLRPDGTDSDVIRPASQATWTRRTALRTCTLQSVIIAFGLGIMVQIGFLTHQISLMTPLLGIGGAAAAVSVAAMAALCGRLLLIQFADRIDQRATTCAVLLLAATAFTILAWRTDPITVMLANALFGLTVGNVTTLSAIIVRREFGSASFGKVFGMASCGVRLIAALGPGLYGVLFDIYSSYRQPLMLAAGIDVMAATAIMMCRLRSGR